MKGGGNEKNNSERGGEDYLLFGYIITSNHTYTKATFELSTAHSATYTKGGLFLVYHQHSGTKDIHITIW